MQKKADLSFVFPSLSIYLSNSVDPALLQRPGTERFLLTSLNMCVSYMCALVSCDQYHLIHTELTVCFVDKDSYIAKTLNEILGY